ncbi:hypothetical protein FC82_GL000467 [Secundilactobacillus collinoides DSM 20515 = JCM 1123]|uniref:Uncharacterized protein n=1 Tax=Secundilactobacillus collinoides DSM 20515 = JCM 1123 TaxID=1423733 RepID=A0A0R2BDM1_SECCO|nr:hypothetical protein FC82_GL000467 [Secundilactobacillus collinoides DSM 20515 = JCM 1123]
MLEYTSIKSQNGLLWITLYALRVVEKMQKRVLLGKQEKPNCKRLVLLSYGA